MSVQEKKRDWFDLGAKAYSQARPGIYAAPTYVCPICRKPFTVEALDDGRLSKEHVPPQSVGGHELLLTCKECNNTAGTKLDADAKTKEVYGVDVSDIESARLSDILERIASYQERRRHLSDRIRLGSRRKLHS